MKTGLSDQQPASRPLTADLGDQAIEWLVMLQSGDATSRDHAAFADWCAQSPDHARAAAEAQSLFAAIGQTKVAQQWQENPDIQNEIGSFRSPAPGAAAPRRQRRLQPARSRAVWLRPGRLAIAGAMICALMLAIFGGLEATGPIARWTSDYSTAIGQQRVVTLPDGSIAHMNTASALSVDFSGPRREIRLEAGEVIFDVAKDADHPFIVSANGGAARAVGTVYGVRLEDGGANVTVREGIVEVTRGDSEPVRITVGQQAHYDTDGGLRKITDADLAAYGSWQRGKLIFNQRTLSDVMAELQRYQPGRIVVARDTLRDLKVTGVFETTDLDAVFASIAQTTSARVTRLPLLTIIY
ncbi:FecR family protein [Thalassospira permensis]|uniref:FecR family protein n=1 Tax=Thalassospira permensis TaxID=680197 RepID=UPI00068FAD78|nr:FecR family protein [Thalassospira permensis]